MFVRREAKRYGKVRMTAVVPLVLINGGAEREKNKPGYGKLTPFLGFLPESEKGK